MASFTINTSTTEDNWFSQARTIYNQDNGTSLTAAQFFDLMVREPGRARCQAIVEARAQLDRSSAFAAFDSASPSVRAQVRTLLGL